VACQVEVGYGLYKVVELRRVSAAQWYVSDRRVKMSGRGQVPLIIRRQVSGEDGRQERREVRG
jgi:hypothetical protein